MYARQLPVQNILLIDDDEDDFYFFSEAVKNISNQINVSYIQESDTGSEKLEELHPDLIFLDINMPRNNGFECLKKLKESRYKDIPVVMYTTTRNAQSIKKAYESGAHLFFTKPFDFNILVSALKDILTLNWTEPAKITSNYFSEGKYQPFEVA